MREGAEVLEHSEGNSKRGIFNGVGMACSTRSRMSLIYTHACFCNQTVSKPFLRENDGSDKV